MFTSVLLNLFTPDIERSAVFYRDQLGGKQTFQYPPQGPPEHVEVRIGAVTIAMSSYDAAVRAGLPTPSPGHPMELAVECESVDGALAALRDAGVAVLTEPVDHVAGHRRAYVTDPDGNWIALVDGSVT